MTQMYLNGLSGLQQSQHSLEELHREVADLAAAVTSLEAALPRPQAAPPPPRRARARDAPPEFGAAPGFDLSLIHI